MPDSRVLEHIAECMQDGWGRSWSYVVAFGRLGVADVSLRYSKDHVATRQRQRRILDPKAAIQACAALTSHLRHGLSSEEAKTWSERDAQESMELRREAQQPDSSLPGDVFAQNYASYHQ